MFKNKIAVKRHIEGMHEGKKRVNCDLCDQNFASKQALNYHTAAIHEGKKFAICSEEGKYVTWFLNSEAGWFIKRHWQQKSLKDKNLECYTL